MAALVIAHRTCPRHEAENSLAGIKRAGALGADGVEIDVRLTRDGVPVLLHDHTLGRVLGFPLSPRTLSLLQLRSFTRRDNRRKIPTFAEALAALPADVLMAIDMKDPRAAHASIQEVRRQNAEKRVLLWAQSMDAVRTFARELPEVERALLRDTFSDEETARFLDDAARCEAQAISAHWDVITPEFVAEAKGRGLRVFAMAQNVETQAEKLAAGLDAIVTDWPEEALALVGAGSPARVRLR